jgi:hypothetical protein
VATKAEVWKEWRKAQMTIEERKSPTTKEDIARAMLKGHQSGAKSLTRKDIAQLVARKVTPRLIGLIEELHTDGKIARGVEIWPNGVRGYAYALKGGEE